MISLQVKRSIKLPADKSILVNAAQVTLELTGQSPQTDLSIVLGNDSFLRRLNKSYRGMNTTTDVLSFPSGEVDPDTSILYLGDVLISLPQAQRQAASENHSVEAELQLLVVHGVLHLLGYDHLQTADKKRMYAIQNKIFNALNLSLDISL